MTPAIVIQTPQTSRLGRYRPWLIPILFVFLICLDVIRDRASWMTAAFAAMAVVSALQARKIWR